MSTRKFTLMLLVISLLLFSPMLNTGSENDILGRHIRINFPSASSEFSTLFGGSGSETSTRITTDSNDNIIMKFMTTSEDLPTTANALQSEYAGGIDDGFIAKFSPLGNLIFATYLGGSGNDHIVRVVTDVYDNIFVVGSTASTDLHVTDDAMFSDNQGSEDGFLMKISSNGTLLYSSYFGGEGVDRIQHVMFHEDGSILLEGYSGSPGLATEGAYQTTVNGGPDSFVAKLDSDLSEIQMFSYFGGSGEDYAWRVDIDSEYNFIICGESRSSNLPTTPDALCGTYSGGTDGFFAKISSDGSTLLYATYIGGSRVDFGGGVDVDSSDGFYITGVVSSEVTNLEYTEEMHQGGMDFFAARFTEDCELVFFKLIGGNRTDLMWDAILDNDENIVIVGQTYSDDYPSINAVQSDRMYGNDACVTVLSSDGETILLSTYLGGSANEKGEGIAIQSDGSIIVSGYSASNDFPTSSDAYQTNRTGSNDAFLYHIDPNGTMTTSNLTSTSTQTESQNDESWITLIAVSTGMTLAIIAAAFVMKRKFQNS